MAPSLLDIPSELRLRILEYAVTLDPIVICTESRDHSPDTETPLKGLTSNPRLNLYLICSQINSELMTINVPLLELKMCKYTCIDEYFGTHTFMRSRIGSVEVPFVSDFPGTPAIEQRTKENLLLDAGPWASKVDLVVMTTFRGGFFNSETLFAKGKAIFRH